MFGALTRLTGSSVWPPSTPTSVEMPSRRTSCSAIRPRTSTSTRSTEPLPRPAPSRPSFSHRGTKGASASIVSGRTAGMLTALVTTPPVSAATTCSAVTIPARSWASAVEAPRCGVTTTSSRPNSGCSVIGSVGKTSRAAPPTLPESSAASQRIEVDQLAAGAVDDPDAVLHLGERVGVEPVDRLRGLRQVDRDQVGAPVELLARVDPLDAELAEALGGDELVEGDHVHVEGERPAGDELADPAEADHPERLAVELVAAEARPRPLAGGQRGVGLRHVAEQRQRQRQRVLGGGDGVRLGGVGDDDPAVGRGADVDVVHSGAGAPDRPHPVGALDQLGGHLASPSGSRSRRTRRFAIRARRRPNPSRPRRRSARAGGRLPPRRSSP